jgi:uncharacterized protein (TIGR02271 family)
VGDDREATGRDDAMTRSEEELRVGTEARERGRVRLRKYVTTEQVTQTVPVQREQVRLEPVPAADDATATGGPGGTDSGQEVVLHEEEPVVEKRVVPKERVRLGKQTVTGEEEVTEEVRKERIELEEGPAGSRR